jgi:hypothetical protein
VSELDASCIQHVCEVTGPVASAVAVLVAVLKADSLIVKFQWWFQ